MPFWPYPAVLLYLWWTGQTVDVSLYLLLVAAFIGQCVLGSMDASDRRAQAVRAQLAAQTRRLDEIEDARERD